MVASKCTLAARVDSFHESAGAEVGESKESESSAWCSSHLENFFGWEGEGGGGGWWNKG